jgi:ABC-type transporter Mla subunit MlaD
MPRDPKQKVHKDFNEGIYHRPPTGPSFFAVGVLTAIVLVILSYFAFVKELPFGSQYEVTATFENAATLRATSPVRIAGVNVGEVTDISLDGEVADVTFTVEEDGLPLHSDSQVTIRPRLFLEGNFFLDLKPGSPSAQELSDDGVIPVTATSTAVQLDQVLTALQGDEREALGRLLEGYGTALTHEPSAAEDVGQDPAVHGESAAEALNDAFEYGGEAGRDSAIVADALLGREQHDLSALIEAQRRIFEALNSREGTLAELISNLNTTMGALAAEQSNLATTISLLPPTLDVALPTLIDLNASLPVLRTFAREARPGIEQLPATIEAAFPWLDQAEPLLGDDELGGIAASLQDATPDLALATLATTELLPQVELLGRCVSEVVVPVGLQPIEDEFATGQPSYRDFFYALVGLAGESQGFDGNGAFVRVQTGGGPLTASTTSAGANPAPVYAHTIADPIGSQPVAPSEIPPVRTDVPCHSNLVPDLNGPAAGVGPPSPDVP